MIKKQILTVALMASLLSAHAWADENAIGYVKVKSGEASISSSNGIIAAEVGTPLHLGNVLKTGENGSLGVTFKDNTMVSLGPDTEVTIDEYLFAPANGELKLAASLAKGTLQYISGVIAKLRPEAVSVKTPTGIIGVRGTRFLAKVEAE